MEIHELEVLTAVVETGGFRRAAKRLAQTQSAVSQTIARMERRIGTPLLVRTSPPSPTPAGQRVLEFARGMFDDFQTLERDLADIQGQSTGRVRLGASQMATRLHLESLIPRFARKYPKASFDVASVPSRELVLMVGDDRCEIGFGPLQQQMRRFETHPYYEQRMRLAASRKHPVFDELRRGEERALKKAVLITSYLDPVENRPNPRRLRYRFQGVWQIANLAVRVDLIARGMGIGYLPEQLIREHPRATDLAALSKFEHGSIERQVGIYHVRNRRLSPMGQLFVEFCNDHFARRKSARRRRSDSK